VRLLICAALGAALFQAASCRSFTAYCEEAMDCMGGNEADIEACKEDSEAEADRASLYGCSDEFDLLADCQEAESECEDAGDDGIYTSEDRCESESEDFGRCMADGGLGI
jgi:hypothetical protein